MRIVIDTYRRPKDRAWVCDVFVGKKLFMSLVSPRREWCLVHAVSLIEKVYGQDIPIELHGPLPDELQPN